MDTHILVSLDDESEIDVVVVVTDDSEMEVVIVEA